MSHSRHEVAHTTPPPAGAIIGRTLAESTPHHKPRPRPAGRPNVLVVLLDDVGFAQLGCFGSDIGFPGYTARIPKSAASLGRVLRDAGWNTMTVGKWHLTPHDDRSAAGPFDTWPLGMGFERYYGFLHGDANQWTPTLVRDNSPIEPPTTPEQGYHLTEDLVDQAITMVRDQHNAAPESRPSSTSPPARPTLPTTSLPRGPRPTPVGTTPGGSAGARRSSPARSPWASFPRAPSCPSVPTGSPTGTRSRPRSSASSPASRRSSPAHHPLDHHLGRLLDELEEALGVLDDTMVVLTSDNGASAEGGPIGSTNEHRFGFGVPDSLEDNLAGLDDIGGFRSYNHYPWGWAWAGNTPFRLWKRYTWLGGTRTSLIVKPSARAVGAGRVSDPGSVRPQVAHIVDVFPTVLDACGIAAPDIVDGVAQQRIDGASMTAAIADGDAPAFRTPSTSRCSAPAR